MRVVHVDCHRFNCQYEQYVGSVMCTKLGLYHYKAFGLDDNGYVWQRTNPVKCVQGMLFAYKLQYAHP
jgi:hypothetical protein